MESTILNKKIELIQWLSTLEDKQIIEKLVTLREESEEDFWDKISEEEKASIEKGISDADNNLKIPHDTVKNNYAKWL